MTSLLWSKGKRALRTNHRRLVSGSPARSVDLDEQLASRDPDEYRWDYVVEARASRRRRGSGVEVHDGNVGEVDVMIAKKRWAVRVLAELEPDLAVERWHWVVPPGARFAFPPTDRRARELARAGVERPSRQIASATLFA